MQTWFSKHRLAVKRKVQTVMMTAVMGMLSSKVWHMSHACTSSTVTATFRSAASANLGFMPCANGQANVLAEGMLSAPDQDENDTEDWQLQQALAMSLQGKV